MIANLLKQLYTSRSFIIGSIKREFQSKYMNSLLGIIWTILQPLSMILVYTLIFSQIMQARLPGIESRFGYSIYLCAGILTWALFSEITSRTQNTFIENAGLIKKLNFPKICLPFVIICNASINFAIIFSLFTLFLIITGSFPGVAFLLMVPVLGIQILFATGLGMTLGVLNVFFRDVGHLFNIMLQFWFWLTPIVYPANILPERLKIWLQINPMAGIISAYQNIILYGEAPSWIQLMPAMTAGVLFCWLGLHLYRKHGSDMVDEL